MKLKIVIAILLCSQISFAKDEFKVKNVQKDSYEYEFEDDPLASTGFGPNDSRIRVRKGAQRATLIKPRTKFVKEIIKSVEDL
jgi:hypothetical protein